MHAGGAYSLYHGGMTRKCSGSESNDGLVPSPPIDARLSRVGAAGSASVGTHNVSVLESGLARTEVGTSLGFVAFRRSTRLFNRSSSCAVFLN